MKRQSRRQHRAPSFRRLMQEQLERRLLLTAVTSEDPAANSFDAPVSTNVAATFDEAINPATATADTFVVASQSGGRLTAADATVTTDGQTVTLDPNANFWPGDRVSVTATSGIQGTSANEPHVWQFRTGVSAGSGQFTNSGQTLGGDQDGEIWYSDLDSDGDLDFVRAGASVWLNDGNGIFTDTGQTLGGTNGVIADVDGDGDADILEANDVYINDGNGIFAGTGQDLTPAGGALAVEAGDVDGDGDIDAISGIAYSGNIVWLNNGSGTFANSGQSLGSSASRGLALGDFDGDGDLDLISANNGQANRVWLNDGNGVFSSDQQLGTFEASNQADTGDVDGDGDLDLVISSNPGTRLYLNDGNGVFVQSGPIINPGTSNEDAQLGDLDGDGDLDVYATGWNNDSEIWTNDGSGNFSLSQNLNPGGFHRSGWVGLFDVDSDGDLDAVQGQRFTGAVVWINQNLQPSVSLSIDNATIPEAAGAATVSATLSAAHTAEVTVDLGFSGTATATDDYTTSGAQIVIPAGQTSGSVTITAVDDTVDEPDETVIVEMTSAANADRSGGTVTTTILDNDEAAPLPEVTLSVDNAAIPEAEGVANFTATLSIVTTVAVTVDLGFSGSAAASDYTASGNQIVIPPGATTGSISVTAVQDTEDEDDETVIVDVTNVTGGTEAVEQQQTTTINDDDDPVMPGVALSVDNAEIAENGGQATFTATLSETTTVDVTVDLELTGTATSGADYNASGTQIMIAAGATTGSVTVSALDDDLDEPNETVVVDISGVTNGTETDTQQVTTTITDDDEPQGFAVAELTPTASGFQVTFSNPIDGSDLNLIDSETGGLGPADVVLVGTASGPVAGSVIVSDQMVEFIKTGDALAADNYTVTLRSAANGFKDNTGALLDGDGDGTPGGDYSSQFTVNEPAAGTVTVGIPDIVRGPGQEVNVPANVTTGIPLSLSDGTNIRAIDARIAYDPDLLNITAAAPGPDAPAGASVVLNSSTPGLAILVYFSSNPLAAGEVVPITLTASVPTDNASANYGSQQILDVHDVVISDGNDNESPVLADQALHVLTFFADVTANGRLNAADAAGIARVAALLDGGFTNTPLSDPGLLGDISGNNRLNAADASLAAQAAALIPVDQIPPIPGGVVITGLSLGPNREDLAVGPEDIPAFDDVALLGTTNAPEPYVAIDRVLTDLDSRGLDGGAGEELWQDLETAIDELFSTR